MTTDLEKANNILALCERVWEYTPRASGSTTWTPEEKDEVIKSITGLEAKLHPLLQKKLTQRKKKNVDKSEQIMNNLLTKIDHDSKLVIELFANLVDSEDLERIEKKLLTLQSEKIDE